MLEERNQAPTIKQNQAFYLLRRFYVNYAPKKIAKKMDFFWKKKKTIIIIVVVVVYY